MQHYYILDANGELIGHGITQDMTVVTVPDGATLHMGQPPDSLQPPQIPADIQARIRRQQLLDASDWRMLPDSPLTPDQRAAWAAYRQALRDLPLHPDWPHVIFPDPPQE